MIGHPEFEYTIRRWAWARFHDQFAGCVPYELTVAVHAQRYEWFSTLTGAQMAELEILVTVPGRPTIRLDLLEGPEHPGVAFARILRELVTVAQTPDDEQLLAEFKVTRAGEA